MRRRSRPDFMRLERSSSAINNSHLMKPAATGVELIKVEELRRAVTRSLLSRIESTFFISHSDLMHSTPGELRCSFIRRQ